MFFYIFDAGMHFRGATPIEMLMTVRVGLASMVSSVASWCFAGITLNNFLICALGNCKELVLSNILLEGLV